MKKVLVLLALLLFANCAQASIRIDLLPTKEHRALAAKVGYNLLNSNRISEKITFAVKNDKRVNAWTYYRNSEIVITSSLIESCAKEDELAAVMAHEISHGVDYRQGLLKGYFSYLSTSLSPKKYEYKADKVAVDYLVKAGYNPLALIVALNLIAPQERYDWASTHPLTSRRMAQVYEYIYTKYPEYLVQNEYKNNVVYQNFLLTSKENRAKLEQKVKNNSKRKVNYL